VTCTTSYIKAAGWYENGIWEAKWNSKEGLIRRISNIWSQRTVIWGKVVSRWVSMCLIAEWGEWMVESEWDLAEEMHSVERVWERICDVLRFIAVSVDNRTKHNVYRAMSLEYWMYKCRVIFVSYSRNSCMCSCFSCWKCIVNKRSFLLNPWAYKLKYIIIQRNKLAFGYAATSIIWHQNIGSCSNFNCLTPEHRFLLQLQLLDTRTSIPLSL